MLGLFLAWPALAEEPTLADRLRSLAHVAEEGVKAAKQNNGAMMQAEFDELHEAWELFEDEIREQNPTGYVELEGALAAVKESLQAQPLDPVAVGLAYEHLQDEATEVAEQLVGGTPVESTAVKATPADLLKNFALAAEAIEHDEAHEAEEQLEMAIQAWPGVEGAIATQSQEAYTAIELDLSRAMAALKAEPADLQGAAAAIERLEETLTPFAMEQTYTAFDAAAIILREGLEALLVIVALLAFLRRSDNSHKRGWIWLGGGLGVLASIITGFALSAVFSQATSGQDREVIEGITGLIAAGLLFYVSYWLHSKASLRAWQQYINASTTRALARGSMVSLTLLAFLAVFREGAETVVFYLGMAPLITWQNLLLGLGIGVVALTIAAILMLWVGLKLPIRPFFRIAGLLVYYLGFKFLGTGIHALQVAGTVSVSPIPLLPALPMIGFYPTWETTVPQLFLLVAALSALFYLRVQDRKVQVATSAVTP
jgi:high-affinity iron transporter